MRNYAAIYGKLGAIWDRFLTIKDVEQLDSAQTFSNAAGYLASRGLIPSGTTPREIERTLRESFLAKLRMFLFYLPASDRNFLEFLLYKYDIYNLKILLALHFSERDRQTTEFVYRQTPLFKRYAFLIDRERLVDKDILLAFRGTKVFPFLMHTYRSYKETGDLFFLDTVLEDAYYQYLLSMVQQDRGVDYGLVDVLRHVLIVHNLIWGIRMHFVYKLRKEKIYYYLVLPLPRVSTQKFLSLFDTEQVGEFKQRFLDFVQRYTKFSIPMIESDLDSMKKLLFDELLYYLLRASKDIVSYSLKGIVAWIISQEMMIDKISFILYEKYLSEHV